MATMHISDYPQLQSTISESQKIVYLCGTGASMSLGGHVLSWPNWILAGKDFLSPSEQTELDKKIGAWTTNELIGAATYLLCQVKAAGSYQNFMDRTIGAIHPVNEIFKDALRTIWRTGDLITTTNYDIQMEETLGADGITYAAPAEILSVIRGESDNKVIHLHGKYDRLHGIDDIIADGPQYQGILSNSGAQFIQNLISTYPIIIVGCGGTVEDPNLSGFMSFVADKLRAVDIPYFYLTKKGDTLPDLPANAVPVYYGDDYSDLPSFLSELAAIRLQRRAGFRSIVSVNPYQNRKAATSAFGRMHFSNDFNPFVGRTVELKALNSFIQTVDKFSWWTILGEGGIGKSRLVLEWLRNMPPKWFGFFSQKSGDAIRRFKPFTDTVVVFDYVLGQEAQCADAVASYLEIFEDSPYKLRIVLLERRERPAKNNWLVSMKRAMPTDARLAFESGEYGESFLIVEALDASDEIVFVENYLGAYLPLVPVSDFTNHCKVSIGETSKKIQEAYRASVDEACYRPLFLSIFTEVWLSKEGHICFNSTEELLEEYLNKEKNRWRLVLGDDALVDSYLRILAVACAIGRFNITDVYGNNYLEKDCNKLTAFLDDRSGRPGADNVFEDLFVSMDELIEDDGKHSLAYTLMHPDEIKNSDNTETAEFITSLDRDERFAYYAPYVKMDADPHEVYLRMLVNAGVATEAEREELSRVYEARIQRVAALPNHAWVIEPVFPDIINAYIVTYAVNERDAERFAKLARSNSIFGLSNFISRALEDWPENRIIQTIAVTPPDEELNYSEYYAGLLPSIAAVKDVQSVETALLNSVPLFQCFELELWRRIAVVLTDSKDIDRLYDSALRFAVYLKAIAEKVHIREDVMEAIEAYCVGIHNSEDTDKYCSILEKFYEIGLLLPDNPGIGMLLCENFGHLMDLKLYKSDSANLRWEWLKIAELVERHGYSDKMCKIAMVSAHNYMHTLIRRTDIDELLELEQSIDKIFQKQKLCEVAEIDALCLANLSLGQNRKRVAPAAYEKIKQHLAAFPESMHIRAAFVTSSNLVFSQTSEFLRVPDKIVNDAKAWSLQYPDEIEFQEGYFGLLLSRLEYAQAQDMRNEQRRVFREMKAVAERADYSKYGEQNQLMDTIKLLQQIYGY